MHRSSNGVGIPPVDTSAQVYRPKVDVPRLEEIARDLLIAIGENPDREGLRETPRRWANMWKEFIDYDPGKVDTVFTTQRADQMVVVTGMRVWSYCEHHLLPFWADVSVGYITRDKQLGLSKFARIAHNHAHRLQVQEQLVEGIADDLATILNSSDLAVLARGEHLCMTMRGIQTPARMISSVMRGVFREEPQVRIEFLSLCS